MLAGAKVPQRSIEGPLDFGWADFQCWSALTRAA